MILFSCAKERERGGERETGLVVVPLKRRWNDIETHGTIEENVSSHLS